MIRQRNRACTIEQLLLYTCGQQPNRRFRNTVHLHAYTHNIHTAYVFICVYMYKKVNTYVHMYIYIIYPVHIHTHVLYMYKYVYLKLCEPVPMELCLGLLDQLRPPGNKAFNILLNLGHTLKFLLSNWPETKSENTWFVQGKETRKGGKSSCWHSQVMSKGLFLAAFTPAYAESVWERPFCLRLPQKRSQAWTSPHLIGYRMTVTWRGMRTKVTQQVEERLLGNRLPLARHCWTRCGTSCIARASSYIRLL